MTARHVLSMWIMLVAQHSTVWKHCSLQKLTRMLDLLFVQINFLNYSSGDFYLLLLAKFSS